MSKNYVVENTTGMVVYFGKKIPPEYQNNNFTLIPQSNPQPDKNCVWKNGVWVLDLTCRNMLWIAKIQKYIHLEIYSSNDRVVLHRDEIELVSRSEIPATTLSENAYLQWLLYRHQISSYLKVTDITGNWAWSKDSDTVTSANGTALTQVSIGDFLSPNTFDLANKYKVIDIINDTTIRLESAIKEESLVNVTLCRINNIETPSYPEKPL